MCHAGVRTATFHFPATSFTLGKVLIAFGIGTINHSATGGAAVQAGRHYCWVYLIYIDRYTIIEDITFAFEILPSSFLAILDNTPMQLVYVFDSFLKQ